MYSFLCNGFPGKKLPQVWHFTPLESVWWSASALSPVLLLNAIIEHLIPKRYSISVILFQLKEGRLIEC